MADGYQKAGENDFADLDEWLCEYVDGTIDPVVCKALEEYMQLNPELASHVQRLRETRHLLCQYGCSYQAPRGLQPRLRRRLATEIIEESQPILGASGIHLATLATLTSFVAIILIFAIPGDSNSPDSNRNVAGQAFVQSEINVQFPRNDRATPLRTLTNNAYYSRFTRQSVSHNRTYASPSLPLNMRHLDLPAYEAIPQPADAIVASP